MCCHLGLSVRRRRLYEAETDEERDENSQSCGIGDAVRTTRGGLDGISEIHVGHDECLKLVCLELDKSFVFISLIVA